MKLALLSVAAICAVLLGGCSSPVTATTTTTEPSTLHTVPSATTPNTQRY